MVIILLILTSLLGFNRYYYDRYVTHFFKSIPIINTSNDNPYWGTWRSGIQQGLIKPVIGLGPSSSRKHCKTLPQKKIDWLPGKNYCGNHPHNYYIQIFAETGLVGLTLGMLMFYFLFNTCYKGRISNPKCPITSICYIIPLAFFFPFQQTGSFFGQWGNLFIWFPIGFCVAQIQDYKSIFKK
jgi:O-antigen ligase